MMLKIKYMALCIVATTIEITTTIEIINSIVVVISIVVATMHIISSEPNLGSSQLF